MVRSMAMAVRLMPTVSPISPNGRGAIGCMSLAIKDSGDSSRINYVNAHGTSTQVNDKVETLACKTVFGENVPPISVQKV